MSLAFDSSHVYIKNFLWKIRNNTESETLLNMTSKHIYSTTNLSDLQLKEQGNCLFAARKYDDAIICYSKAIVSYYQTLKLK